MNKVLTAICCLALPGLSWANISNTGSATYKDTTGASYNATTNTVVVTVITPPSMTLTKSASPATAKSGDTVTFTIAYQNVGGSDATNFTITDTIPTGSTFKGSITGSGTISGGTITWPPISVAAGASGTVSFQVTVN